MKILKYLLFVLTIFLLACEDGGLLIEPDISDKSVILLAPLNNAEVSSNEVFFDWEPVADAKTYEIQVASPNFDTTAQLLLNTEDSVTVAQLQLNVGEYQWRVRAKNSGYHTPYTTASFKVVPVENFSDNTVILNTPEDNIITNIALQTLEWQPIDGATLYRVQVVENGSVTQELATSETSLDITFSEGESQWQVRAENGIENTFYFSRSILVDITAPNSPQLTAPTDEEELSSGDVSFEWIRDFLEGSVEFDSIYVYRDINLTDLVVKEEATSPYNATLTNDTYYWFVKGFDEAGNEGNASNTFSFIVNE
tara:strand:- start:52216 stop:53148 length:933 start_codon:yes stop_codon:yes gene_type:complete